MHAERPFHPLGSTRAALWPALILFAFSSTLPAQTIIRPLLLPPRGGEAGTVVVEFQSGGHTDAAGRGIGVFDETGNPARHRLLAHDPAGHTMIAIDVSGASAQARTLRLHYGRAPLREAQPASDLPVSLVLRTFSLTQRAKSVAELGSLERIVRELQGAAPLGAALVEHISFAHNPFGDSTHFVSDFEGLIELSEPRTLNLFSFHDDAALVQINGKTVIESPGPTRTRSSEALGQLATEVRLDRGTHRIRYVHVQTEGSSLALLGQMAGQRALPVPPGLFVHHPEVGLGSATTDNETPAIGFDATYVDELEFEQDVFTRFALQPIAPAPRGAEYHWTFTDGTSFRGEEAIEHVFPGAEGPWAVKLELVRGDSAIGSATTQLRPRVLKTPGSPGAGGPDILAAYARALGGLDFSHAPRETIEAFYALAETTERPDLLAPLAEAYLDRFARRGSANPLADQMKYALATHVAGRDPQRAEDLFADLAASARDPWMAACAAAEQVDLLLYRLDRRGEVPGLVQRLASGREPRNRALLMARLGDVHRLEGRMQKARDAYHAAQKINLRQLDPSRAAVLQRAHRETALSALRQERFPALRDALFQWEADFPSAKLEGDLPLLTARYFQATGDDARAVKEMETLLALNPLHPRRPEILFRLAQSLVRLDRIDQARAHVADLVDKYPRSPFVEEAKELIAP